MQRCVRKLKDDVVQILQGPHRRKRSEHRVAPYTHKSTTEVVVRRRKALFSRQHRNGSRRKAELAAVAARKAEVGSEWLHKQVEPARALAGDAHHHILGGTARQGREKSR